MIQFNLSSELTSILGLGEVSSSDKLLPSDEVLSDIKPSMIWFAHIIEIKGVRCIITVEQQTRYGMVFCGLSNHDLAIFDRIFKDRLWREVFAICHEGNERIIQHLAQHILSLCEEQSYQGDYDRSIYGLIRLIAADLEARVYDSGLDLPIDPGDAFEFGVEINNALRNVPDRDLQYFTPIESFKRQCLGQLSDVVPLSLFSDNSLSAIARYLGEGRFEPNHSLDTTAPLSSNPSTPESRSSEACASDPGVSENSSTDKSPDANNVIEVDFFTRRKKYQFTGMKKHID